MASQFTQVIGEAPFYEQDVIGDVISGAIWDSSPSGPNVTVILTNGTESIAQFESDAVGDFVLTCKLTLVSGQILKGQARISVVQQKV